MHVLAMQKSMYSYLARPYYLHCFYAWGTIAFPAPARDYIFAYLSIYI